MQPAPQLYGKEKYQPVVEEMYRRIWTFGLAHEEHLLNEYIATAMADHGPGIVVGKSAS